MKKVLTSALVGVMISGSALAYRPERCTGSPVRACKPYVLFDYESATIKPEETQYLDWACDKAKAQYWRNMIVYGHADQKEGENINLDYGMLRANAVRDYLIGCGIDPKRIQVRSLGKRELLTRTPEEQFKNRRAVIRYTVNYFERGWNDNYGATATENNNNK